MSKQREFCANKDIGKFMKELNNEISELEGRTMTGLIKACVLLQRAAEPGTPVDLGNLRASWFIVTYRSAKDESGVAKKFKGEDAGVLRSEHSVVTKKCAQMAAREGSKIKPVAIFGYSANYAAAVHDKVGATFKRPGAHARWLYKAMERSKSDMLEVIAKEAAF